MSFPAERTAPETPASVVNEVAAAVLHGFVERWRAGDRAALDELLARVHPMLYRWALANALDVDDAEDIAQQALVTVYRKLHQYRGEAPLIAWLYRLTRRTATQRRRTFARRQALDVLAHAEVARRVYETDPGGRVDRERLTALVRACYEQLPPQQRAVFSLVDLEGYTPTEAAELMEIAPVTLRANLFKARSSIRRRVFQLSPALAERFAVVEEPRELADGARTATTRIAS